MLTSVVMPKLVAVRPVGFPASYALRLGALGGHYSADRDLRGCVQRRRPVSGVKSVFTGPGGGLCAVPVACPNEAGTTDIERHPDGDRTGRDQECGS